MHYGKFTTLYSYRILPNYGKLQPTVFYGKAYIDHDRLTIMPARGYKTITVREDIYNALSDMARSRGISIQKLLEELISGNYSDPLKRIESKIDKLIELVQGQKPKFKDAARDAFLGIIEPVRAKGIEVSKGQIFVKRLPDIDLSEFNATVVEEKDAAGNVVGYAIIPNLGFSNAAETPEDELEEWFNKYGLRLIKALLR